MNKKVAVFEQLIPKCHNKSMNFLYLQNVRGTILAYWKLIKLNDLEINRSVSTFALQQSND